MSRDLRGQRGITLLELMVLIGVLGILASLTALSPSNVAGQKLSAGSREFIAELHNLRQLAIRARKAASGLGYGLRFESNSVYRTFEFNDTDQGFDYDGAAEESGAVTHKLATGTTLTVGAGGAAAGATLFFDQRGMPRSGDWSPVSSLTYVLRNDQVSTARCVNLTTAWIREGAWDAAASTCRLR